MEVQEADATVDQCLADHDGAPIPSEHCVAEMNNAVDASDLCVDGTWVTNCLDANYAYRDTLGPNIPEPMSEENVQRCIVDKVQTHNAEPTLRVIYAHCFEECANCRTELVGALRQGEAAVAVCDHFRTSHGCNPSTQFLDFSRSTPTCVDLEDSCSDSDEVMAATWDADLELYVSDRYVTLLLYLPPSTRSNA